MKVLFKSLLAYGMLALPLLAVSCKKDTTTKLPDVPAVTGGGTTTGGSSPNQTYKMIWNDEFEGTSVNANNWVFETGNLNVNNEKEYYQSQNTTLSNGNLVITAKAESKGIFPYTSSRLNTQNKFSVQYGRIEARIKIPLGAGLWPAFWMLGDNINTVSWPKCGEIDIMEHVNADNKFYGTIHWDNNGHAQYGLSATTDTPDDYHIYAIEWTPTEIKWFLDDKLFCTADTHGNVNSTEEFNAGKFFIILNLAVAGDFPGQKVDLSKLPASMYVDYVRVYQLSK
ncbi:glycoside hydrolase family 16 protein [Mucilaginibacter koreensis]